MVDPDMLFDLNVKDADRNDVLSDFFRQAGRAYEIDDEFADTVVTVRKADVGFQDALDLILPTGYIAQEIGGIYHIRKMG